MQISKLHNSNVYIDGTNSLLGRGKEITLPDVVSVTEDHKGMGMIGVLQLPTGSIEAMLTKVKWGGFYPEQLTNGANPFKSHRIQVRANVATHGAGGVVQNTPLVITLGVVWKKTPLGVLTPATDADREDELPTHYVKVVHGGVELLEIDVHENVWRVNGVDVLETVRANLGG